MFETILVATDLSAASDALIDGLRWLRSLGAGDAVLCHALQIHGHESLFPMLARFVEPRLQQQQERLEGIGFTVIVEIAPGVPALEIHRVASERSVDLIAIGSHGATVAREILLGGTATEALHHAQRPVLIVRTAPLTEGKDVIDQREAPGQIRGVLHPTDFSKASLAAFSCVDEMVARGTPNVHLVHVSERPHPEFHAERVMEEAEASSKNRLEGLKERLLRRGAKEVTTELLTGKPGREVVARASRKDCDLIVMGSQGRGLLDEVFLGSVSHHVVRHAPLPVLLVPFKGVKGGCCDAPGTLLPVARCAIPSSQCGCG